MVQDVPVPTDDSSLFNLSPDSLRTYLARSGQGLTDLWNGLGGSFTGMARDAIHANNDFLAGRDSETGATADQMSPYDRANSVAHFVTNNMTGGALPLQLGQIGRLSQLARTGGDASAFGIFGGAGAKTADLGALETAKGMAAAGHTPDAIRDATGWHANADKGWRFEIPDDQARYTGDAVKDSILRTGGTSGDLASRGYAGTLGDFLDHPPLYEAYPGMKDMPVTINPRLPSGGKFSPPLDTSEGMGSIELNPVGGANKSVALHEVQHATQHAEDFATGGSPQSVWSGQAAPATLKAYNAIMRSITTPLSPSEYARLAWQTDRLNPEIIADYKKNYIPTTRNPGSAVTIEAQRTAGKDVYNRLVGETEARNVQQRMNLTPEQRAQQAPWATEDVPPERQVVTMGLGKGLDSAAESSGTVAMSPPAAPAIIKRDPIIAYHGSPHDFDRFDVSKIGTGEGNQAYGHGLYFAGNERVARGYRDALSRDVTYGGQPLGKYAGDTAPVGTLGALSQLRIDALDNGMSPADALARELAGRRKLAEDTRNIAASYEKSTVQDPGWGDIANPAEGAAHFHERANQHAAIADWLSGLDPSKLQVAKGHMYQVGLDVDPASLIDWDKSLSEQSPMVRKLMEHYGYDNGTDGGSFMGRPVSFAPRTGGSIYKDMVKTAAREAPDPDAAHFAAPFVTEDLYDQGIDGIRYLDGQSRKAGEGSSNYVMFNHAPVSILKKYAFPLAALGAGGLAGADGASQ